MSELSVLVVEDDAVLNRVIQAALERAGYRTHASETCADGVALANREMPGLLVLDVNLPDALRGTCSKTFGAVALMPGRPW